MTELKHIADAIPGGYISTSEAARIASCTQTHIGRICRSGEVECVRIGREWFIAKTSLEAHLSSTASRKEVRAEELSQERQREYQEALKQKNATAPAVSPEPAPTPIPVPGFSKSIGLAALALLVAGSAFGFAISGTGVPMNVYPSANSLAAVSASNAGSGFLGTLNSIGEFISQSVLKLFGLASAEKTAVVQTNTPIPPTQPKTNPTAPTAVSLPKPTVIQQTIAPRNVIEKITEYVTLSGISESLLADRLNQLENKLTSKLYQSIGSPAAYVPLPPSSGGFANNIALLSNIDHLDGVILNNPTIIGGSISGTSGVGEGSLTGSGGSGTLAIWNGSSLSGTTTPTVDYLTATSTATSTFTGGISASSLSITNLSGCDTIDTDSNGQLKCGTDQTGSGAGTPGGANNQVQFNDNGNFGGDAGFTYSSSTDLVTVTNASTTRITSTYASSTQGFFGSLSVSSLSGILKATAGAIGTALVNLATDITGILPVANGGTGWANIFAGAIPYGNGSGALSTTTAGTNGQVLALVGGVPTWTATSTLATISGTLGVANGGTNATSQTTNGVNYFDGTRITSGTGLVYTGTNFGIGTTSPAKAFSVAGALYIDSSGYGPSVIGNSTNITGFGGTLGANDILYIGTSTSGTNSIREVVFVANSTGGTAATIIQALNAFAGYEGTADLTTTSGGGGIRNRYGAVNASVGHNVAKESAVSAVVGVTGTEASTTDAAVFNAETPSVVGGNLLTNFYSFRAEGGAVTGTLTNRYGLYIDDLVGGTTRYGVYQAGSSDSNYFAGNVGIGTTSPYAALSVAGPVVAASFTATTTASSTFAGGVEALSLRTTNLISCDTIDTDANGQLKCGTDATGGGGSSIGESFALVNGALAPTTTVGIIVSASSTFAGNVTITGNSTTTNATTTNLKVSNELTIGSLSGFLKATAGKIATATIDLVNDVGTSILAVANGGTGWASLQANALLLGNGTGRVATTSAGTNGQTLALVSGAPTWVATTTAGTGLTYTGSAFTVNTSQNIGTLSNLTSNGFVITSGGTGALSVDTTSYLAAAYPYLTVTNFGTTTAATTTPLFARTGLFASSTSQFANASTTLLTTTGTTYLASAGGNVGIGTTSPSSLFSINGVANFAAATTTFSSTGGIDLKSGGCFAINGTCVGGSSFSNTIANGGTATTTFYNGGLVFYNSTLGTLSQASAQTGLFYNNSTSRLGVGTTTPGALLSVSSSASEGLYIDNPSGQFSVMRYLNGGAIKASTYWDNTNSRLENSINSTGNFTWVSNGSEWMRIGTTGNVGIGTTTPWGLLSVNPNALGANVPSFVIGSSSATSFIINNAGNVGVGTSSPATKFETTGDISITRGAGTSDGALLFGGVTGGTSPALIYGARTSGGSILAFYTASNERVRIDNSGNVGIGSTTPGYKLGVTGSASFGSAVATTRRSDFDTGGRLTINYADNSLASNLTLTNFGVTAVNQGINILGQISSTSPGAVTVDAGGIRFVSEDDFTTAAKSTAGLAFLTESAGTANERLRITGAGNVGIGTTVPGAKLSVLSTVSIATTTSFTSFGSKTFGLAVEGSDNQLALNAPSGTQYTSMYWLNNSASVAQAYFDNTNNKFEFGATKASSQLDIYAGGSVAATVLSSGNVGIGTTTPAGKLNVYGGALLLTSSGGDYTTQQNTAGIVFDTITRDQGIEFITSSFQSGYGFRFRGQDPADGIGTKLLIQARTNSSSFATNVLTLRDDGRIGIGTTSPGFLLSTSGGANTRVAFKTTASTTAAFAVENSYGKNVFQVDTLDTAGSIFSVSTSTGATYFTIAAAGNTGVGSTTPFKVFSVAGSGAWSGLTAAASGNVTLCINAGTKEIFEGSSATSCTPSSARFKNTITDSDGGIDELSKLRPVTFFFNDQGDPMQQLGFIAEEAYAVDPRLVNLDGQGNPYSLKLDNFLSLTVSSVQDLDKRTRFISGTTTIADLVGPIDANATTTPWKGGMNGWSDALKSAAGSAISGMLHVAEDSFTAVNGAFAKIFAGEVHTDKICVAKSDGTEFCANGDQLAALAASGGNGGGTSGGGDSEEGEAPDTESPAITILGNNPATIVVGDTYADQGATVTDNVDQNLGIHIYMNGEEVQSVSIDTSAPGTFEITYQAADNAGNVAGVMRTVVVSAPTP